MSLYSCDGCAESIPAHKARIHCEQCLDYDACANCYVVGNYTKGHTEAHGTYLEETSGTWPRAPSLPTRPTGPASTLTISNSQGNPEVPQAGCNAPGPAGWGPLFNSSQATPLGASFFSSIFNCLDTKSSGVLAPEQYSAFLDILDYDLDGNVWKRNMKPQFGYNPEEIADFELRTSYENFSIEHTLQLRSISPNRDLQNLASSYPATSVPILPPLTDGKMPMLTRKGFIDITTVEILADPSAGWPMMNRMVRYYGVWREWGDVPRNMLPESAPKELLDRISRITEVSRRQAVERIEAKRVEAEIKAQVGENISRLFDPPGIRYYYSYR